MQRGLEACAAPQLEGVSNIDEQRIVDHARVAPPTRVERLRRRQDLQALATALALEQEGQGPIVGMRAGAVRVHLCAWRNGGVVQEPEDRAGVWSFVVLAREEVERELHVGSVSRTRVSLSASEGRQKE